MLPSEELEEKIRKARIIAQLKQSEGWKIIADKLVAEIENQRNLCTQMGVDQARTEAARYRIHAMRWMLDAVNLDSPEQVAKWEKGLAFQRQQEKMRVEQGLSPDPKDLPR